MQDEDAEPYAQALTSVLRREGGTSERRHTRADAREILCKGCGLSLGQADAVIAYALANGILAEQDGQLRPV
jgi:hypothetical protein